jgi:hypothetical protein
MIILVCAHSKHSLCNFPLKFQSLLVASLSENKTNTIDYYMTG